MRPAGPNWDRLHGVALAAVGGRELDLLANRIDRRPKCRSGYLQNRVADHRTKVAVLDEVGFQPDIALVEPPVVDVPFHEVAHVHAFLHPLEHLFLLMITRFHEGVGHPDDRFPIV